MDPRIWSGLPDHLLERVLSLLPLKTFIALRSTCKHFNSLLFTPLFISKHNSLSSSSLSSFILLAHPHFPNKFPLFNTLTNSWQTTSLSLPPPLSSQPSILLSSSNGLLCFSIPSSSCFVICNLLTKSLRRVKFPKRPFNFELLTLKSTANGPNYLFTLSSTTAHLYDTGSGSWKQYPGFDPLLSGNSHQTGVYFNGALVFTTPEPFRLVSFRLDTGEWGTPAALPPQGLTFVRLVKGGDGRLYLVGGVGISGITRSLKIWEMREDEGWVEAERMPEMVCRKFVSICYHNFERVLCFWHEGLICVGCYTWPQLLYYKVERRTWHWLPVCPDLPHKWTWGFRWFSFKPEIYATV